MSFKKICLFSLLHEGEIWILKVQVQAEWEIGRAVRVCVSERIHIWRRENGSVVNSFNKGTNTLSTGNFCRALKMTGAGVIDGAGKGAAGFGSSEREDFCMMAAVVSVT